MRDRKKSTPAPVPSAPSEEIAALKARMDAMEKASEPKSPWAQMADRHLIQREREIAALSRVSPDSPCAACGDASADQRRMESPELLGHSGWLCVACITVAVPGWGTQSTKMLPRSAMRDRLASLAAGQESPTQGFAVLASRYGLTFQLAQDAPGAGDGTAWSHLGGLAEWRRVGALATRRQAAGFGVLPCVSPDRLQAPAMVLGTIPDWAAPRGYRLGAVEERPETPARNEAATLTAEEKAVEQALKDQRRQAKELEAAAAERARAVEVRRHYRQHRAQLEREIIKQRAALRGDLRAALGKGQ